MPMQIMTLRELEKWAILSAMKRTSNNLTAVCRELGVGRTTLYRKLRSYGWRRPAGCDADRNARSIARVDELLNRINGTD